MNTLSFPSSLLLALVYVLTVVVLHVYGKDKRWIVTAFLGSKTTGIALLAIVSLMLGIEATWALPVHTTVPFITVQLMLMLSIGMAVCQGVERLHLSVNVRNISFMLNHLGILILLWGAFFGSPDVRWVKVMLFEGDVTNVGYTLDRKVTMIPFSIALDDYETTYYEDGVHPKQFSSHININGERMTTSVNSPCTYDGYNIFQDGADMAEGRYSILQLVRDPWLPVVYIGMFLLLCGSALLLFGRMKLKVTIPLLILLTILFTAFSIKKIEFDTLMPALRSWWFAPHILLYMMAYSLMFIAIVMWMVNKERATALVRASSALLIFGMLTGSVWARQAWADYWAWDPKENWAAVTWLIALIYLHYNDKRSWKAFVIMLLAFLALQITWYGVDYLPSAAHSLHTYK